MVAVTAVMLSETPCPALVKLSMETSTGMDIRAKNPPTPIQKAMTRPAASPIKAPCESEVNICFYLTTWLRIIPRYRSGKTCLSSINTAAGLKYRYSTHEEQQVFADRQMLIEDANTSINIQWQDDTHNAVSTWEEDSKTEETQQRPSYHSKDTESCLSNIQQTYIYNTTYSIL